MSSGLEISGLKGAYNRREFAKGPSTYKDSGFIQKIEDAAQLQSLPPGSVIADLMSGPGGVGKAIREHYPNFTYYFLDLAWNQLTQIPLSLGQPFQADVLHMPFGPHVDVAFARYSIKDLPQDKQPIALKEISVCIKKNGSVVIADMVAPNQEVKEWLNRQHSVKQVFSGRNPTIEGECHIPTEEEWIKLLTDTGFKAQVANRHISHVETSTWLSSKQVTESELYGLNQMLLSAPDETKRTFNIREDNDLVRIDYPVIILRGTKS